jgi:hypothetical protein
MKRSEEGRHCREGEGNKVEMDMGDVKKMWGDKTEGKI